MKPGDEIRARKVLSFLWPNPDNGRRIDIRLGERFKIDAVLPSGLLRVTTATGTKLDLKPKHFEVV